MRDWAHIGQHCSLWYKPNPRAPVSAQARRLRPKPSAPISASSNRAISAKAPAGESSRSTTASASSNNSSCGSRSGDSRNSAHSAVTPFHALPRSKKRAARSHRRQDGLRAARASRPTPDCRAAGTAASPASEQNRVFRLNALDLCRPNREELILDADPGSRFNADRQR